MLLEGFMYKVNLTSISVNSVILNNWTFLRLSSVIFICLTVQGFVNALSV
jgi:hypothetical protein